MRLFKRVLVPLDGSRLAECTLPYVKDLASCEIVDSVVLLSVTDFGEGAVGRDTAQSGDADAYAQDADVDAESAVGRDSARSGDTGAYAQDAGASVELDPTYKSAALRDAQGYLTAIQAQLVSEGVDAEVKVIEGRPASSIVDYANEADVDLVLIATHGRTGFRRLLLGSVANQVLNESHVPVLLIRPSSCR